VRALLQQEDGRGEGALEAEPVLTGGGGGEVGDERRRDVGRGRAGCRGQGLEREPRVVRAALGDGGEEVGLERGGVSDGERLPGGGIMGPGGRRRRRLGPGARREDGWLEEGVDGGDIVGLERRTRRRSSRSRVEMAGTGGGVERALVEAPCR